MWVIKDNFRNFVCVLQKDYRMPHQKINAAGPRVLILRDRSSTFDPFFPRSNQEINFPSLRPHYVHPSTWQPFLVTYVPHPTVSSFSPLFSPQKALYQGCRWKICSLISVLRCSFSASSLPIVRPCRASLFLLLFCSITPLLLSERNVSTNDVRQKIHGACHTMWCYYLDL